MGPGTILLNMHLLNYFIDNTWGQRPFSLSFPSAFTRPQPSRTFATTLVCPKKIKKGRSKMQNQIPGFRLVGRNDEIISKSIFINQS